MLGGVRWCSCCDALTFRLVRELDVNVNVTGRPVGLS